MAKNEHGWETSYRDPNRIDIVLNEVREVWARFPDLRLGQLLVNALPPGRDPFHVEDDQLLEYLAKYLETHR